MDIEELKKSILQDFKLINNIKDKTPPQKPDDGGENPDNTEEIDTDKIYKLYIDKAIQTILNLTNRIYFPIELRYVVLDIANEFYTIFKQTTDNDSESEGSSNNSNGYVKSLSEAGRSVTFASNSETYFNSLISKHIDEELSTRMKEINRYKLLYKEFPRKDDTGE